MTGCEVGVAAQAGPNGMTALWAWCSCGWRGSVRGDRAAAAAEAEAHLTASCPHGDPYCPCGDGDACHYEAVGGSPAAPCPRSRRRDCTCLTDTAAGAA